MTSLRVAQARPPINRLKEMDSVSRITFGLHTGYRIKVIGVVRFRINIASTAFLKGNREGQNSS